MEGGSFDEQSIGKYANWEKRLWKKHNSWKIYGWGFFDITRT